MPQKAVKSLNEIVATVGYTENAAYMARQDIGGTHEAKKDYLAIPTDKARGGAKEKTVKRAYYLSQLKDKKVQGPYKKNHKFGKAGHPGAPKSAGVARAYVAFREKKFIHFKSGLFQVVRFSARNGEVSYKTEQIYILDRKETKTKPKNHFLPAVSKPAANMQAIFSGLPCKHRLAILSGENPGIVKGDVSFLSKIAELTKCTNLPELLEAWENAKNQKKNAVKRADYAFKNYREAREEYGLKNIKVEDMDTKYIEAVANTVDQCVECEKQVKETLKALHTVFVKPPRN